MNRETIITNTQSNKAFTFHGAIRKSSIIILNNEILRTLRAQPTYLQGKHVEQ